MLNYKPGFGTGGRASVCFGDSIFTPPEVMTSAGLLGLWGLEGPGLYVVIAYDATWRPLPYRPLYFGESENVWRRATPAHENHASWQRIAGSATLYRAFHHIPRSTREAIAALVFFAVPTLTSNCCIAAS